MADEPVPVSSDEAMAANLANWNARVPVHVAPDGYGIDRLVDDPAFIGDVVRFDIDRLGDLSSLDVVHLQCHIGTDTVGLAKLGATVTGLDFSPDAIAEARKLADRCGFTDARFVVSDVHDAVEALGATYDLVYTGVGALNWLPSVARWAEVVAALLRPGGRLHLFEGHPFVKALDDDATATNTKLSVPYFETEQPMSWSESTTYAGSGEVASPQQYEWSHGIAEVVQAVLDAGLTLTGLEEHRVLPWRFLDWFEPVPGTDDWTQMPEQLRDVVPMSYTLQALKPAG